MPISARQREYATEIRHGQALRFVRFEPLACCRSLALAAVPVATAVERDVRVPARAFVQRATWPPRAAVRQLSMALITFSWPRLILPPVGITPSAPVIAEDIRDLQSGTGHDRAALTRPVRVILLRQER